MASIASPRVPPSGASTPTVSSRRTSLDTARTSSPTRNTTAASSGQLGAASGAGRRNRADRAALRDYYNLKVPASSLSSPARASSIDASSVSTGGVGDDEDRNGSGLSALSSELDRPDFDAQLYVSELLRSQNLTGVLRVESSLLDEMRELDGERKALVYDNYAKLIAATDTIRGLRKGVAAGDSGISGAGLGRDSLNGLRYSSMAGAIDTAVASDDTAARALELKNMVSYIASTARSLTHTSKEEQKDTTTAQRQSGEYQMEAAASRRRRQTVRWVVESPRRFRDHIDNGRTNVAKEEWKEVDDLLQKWSATKGVAEVRQQCLEALGLSPGPDMAGTGTQIVTGHQESSEVDDESDTSTAAEAK